MGAGTNVRRANRKPFWPKEHTTFHMEWQVTAMFMKGIKSGNTAELEELFKQVEGADLPEQTRLFLAKLKAVLEGSRDLSIAMDTNLDPLDAVELHLLLEEV